MENGKLYVVPTPIGNLSDITYRAVEILKKVSLIACEDTRTSGKLLQHYEIKNKLLSYHKFNEKSRVQQLIEFLKTGKQIALITDAGTPGISDPAALIVTNAIRENLAVEVLPGATALIPALIGSGFSADRFSFFGFLPEKSLECDNLLSRIAEEEATLIFYEAPHRLLQTLNLLLEKFGNRRIVIARELSKLYETWYRSDLLTLVQKPELIKMKGEFVLVIEGKKNILIDESELIGMIKAKLDQNISTRDLAMGISLQSGYSKSHIYDLILKLKNGENI
ncbi:MAG: 16S rRNA (cytidine(1402)-2'-O)-methyltransferase [Candidatus Cloacimonetes bacterium]|nr:16S rRNA (cytidine(1402)-2'-O)-methyltransferase [Candidatus Cloacimonadota bacterium]